MLQIDAPHVENFWLRHCDTRCQFNGRSKADVTESVSQSVNFQSGLSGAIIARTTNWVVSVDSRDMNDCSNKKNMYHHLQRGPHARKTIASFVRVTRQNVWS